MDDATVAAGGIAARLRGAVCTGVARDDAAGSRAFSFGGDRVVLVVNCPWRVAAGGRIARAHGDHGQWVRLVGAR